ncbi:MAG: ATP-grasp domain-containing protein [Candidatus Kerfeldbacteria bacterium]|nr:ATP-grasp domain-containing protein [Candidatus Kerfeldbacteria bacterium]
MKTLVVYFDEEPKMGYPFDVREYYDSYRYFSELCAKNGVQLILVRHPSQYLGGMQFASGWKYAGTELERVTHMITADVVYMKGTHLRMTEGANVVNRTELTEICKDKFKTYELFSEFMSPTFLLTEENAADVMKKITTDKVVIKPVTGTEGRGIVIVAPQEFSYDMLEPHKPYIAQEFVDCSEGMPGIMKGLHDLRMYIYNGVAGFAEYRQPKQGSYLANIAQGGSLTVLDPQTLPQWALDFVPQIDSKFTQFTPRIYTIDLMYANGRPYLVELNSQPGMPWSDWEYFTPMQQKIFETLMSACNS